MRKTIPLNVAAASVSAGAPSSIVAANLWAAKQFDSPGQSSGTAEIGSGLPPKSKHFHAGTISPDSIPLAQIRGLWEASIGALDLLGIGLAICDPLARMLAANSTAAQILLDRDVLQLSEIGELCGVAKDAPNIATVIGRVLDTKNSGQALLMPRVSGRRALTVFVRPAEREQDSSRHKLALVMLLEGTRTVESTPSDLHQLFRFTPQETRLANLLIAGKTIPEACEELGIHVSTGCTHLRKIFKKTGTHRQSELISLLLRTISLVGKSGTRWVGVCGPARDEEYLQAEHDDLGFSRLIQVDVDSSL
jgi:DNA-binding CsgD family transcriptional regulator